MALAERVKQLRTEHHWSQGDLAQTFGVSCDYLLVDNAPRRPFTSPEDALGHQLHDIAELTDDDLELVTRFIDVLVTKTRLKNLTANIS